MFRNRSFDKGILDLLFLSLFACTSATFSPIITANWESLQRKCLGCAVQWWCGTHHETGFPASEYHGAVLRQCCLCDTRLPLGHAPSTCFPILQAQRGRGESGVAVLALAYSSSLSSGASVNSHTGKSVAPHMPNGTPVASRGHTPSSET